MSTGRRMISFSHIELINLLVKDDAIVKNASESAIIEEYVLNSLLPIDNNARRWVTSLLYNSNISDGIQQTLHALFSFNSADLMQLRYANLEPVVAVCCQLCDDKKNIAYTGPDKNYLDYLERHINLIIDRINYEIKSNSDALLDMTLREIRFQFMDLSERIMSEPWHTFYAKIIATVYNAWTIVGEWSSVHRLMAGVCDRALWVNNEKNRVVVRQTIKDVTDDWSLRSPVC